MDKSAAVKSFFEGYGLTELQISTIVNLFESYLADNRIVKGDALFEVCPSIQGDKQGQRHDKGVCRGVLLIRMTSDGCSFLEIYSPVNNCKSVDCFLQMI